MRYSNSVTNFREKYRQENITGHYNGLLHFIFTSAWCLSIIAACICLTHQVTWKEWMILPFTFLYTNFIEYIGHKGPMHHKRRYLEKVFRRHTLQHHHFFTHEHMNCKNHRDFKAVLFPPVLLIFFFFCFVLPASLLIYWLWSANAGLLFMAGILAYYLNYEWLHLAYHLPDGHPVTRLPVIRSLRTAHLHHHDPKLMQQYNFNISYPIFDKIFGTYYKS